MILWDIIKSIIFPKKEEIEVPQPVEPVLPKPKIIHKETKFQKLPKCPTEMKTSYGESLAKREAIKYTKINQTNMRAYKCMFCPHWHITHKKNKLTKH